MQGVCRARADTRMCRLQRLVLVAGVGNFEKVAEVPGDFLTFLAALPSRGVDLVWVATSTKQAERHPEVGFDR